MAKEPEHSTDLMSPRQVAAALHVAPNTVHIWRYRGIMPEPATIVAGCPLWKRRDVAVWAVQTRRMDQNSPLWPLARSIPSNRVRPAAV